MPTVDARQLVARPGRVNNTTETKSKAETRPVFGEGRQITKITLNTFK